MQYYRTSAATWLNIRTSPTHAGFEEPADSYEAAYFGYDRGGRRVADATLAPMVRVPACAVRLVMGVFSRSL